MLGNLHAEGLTKKEIFAAMAMNGLLANGELLRGGSERFKDADSIAKSYAKDSIRIADELLKQLEP
jgi:hypothetical protein